MNTWGKLPRTRRKARTKKNAEKEEFIKEIRTKTEIPGSAMAENTKTNRLYTNKPCK